MTEIVLAEHDGTAWLVGGVEFIDDFLANTLSPDVSIRVVACQSHSELATLWEENDGAKGALQPWAIHPGILARAKGLTPGRAIAFGAWSAMLDDKAMDVLRDAVAEAAKNPAAPVVLKAADLTGEPKPMADLANLRYALVEAELTQRGVDAARIVRATRPPDANDTGGRDRIDIAFQTE